MRSGRDWLDRLHQVAATHPPRPPERRELRADRLPAAADEARQ